MYTFRENISISEFEEFVSKFPFAPIQQTPAWSRLKSNWRSFFCGVYRSGEKEGGETLAGVSLILVRKILPFFSYAYCPRGPVLDFSNKELVEAFKKGIEEFCKKRGIYAVTIDPPIVVGKITPELPGENFLDSFDIEKGKIGFDNLIFAGFSHCGFEKELHSTLQPRYNAVIPLKKADGSSLSFEELKKNFKTKIRKYFANFQSLRGLYYERVEATPENISEFCEILRNTEKRQKISLRGEDYFALIGKCFSDDAFFGFERCDVEVYISTLEKRLEKEPENSEKIGEQLTEAKKILDEKGKTISLAALLTVYPPNKEGEKMAEYLYAGSDLSVFPSFNATLCGLGDQCKFCIDRGLDYLDLGGVSGTLDDGLYEFKKHFSPIIIEYAGEFELKIKKFRYAFMKRGMPAMKRVYKNIIKLFGK